MKRLITLLFCVAMTFFAISCAEKEKVAKKAYFTEYDVYTTSDSTRTKITVYVGKIGDRNVIYHVYDGKYKCQMIVWDCDDLKPFQLTDSIKTDTIKTDTIAH